MKIRKLVTVVEELLSDGGREVERPRRKVAPRAGEIVLAIALAHGGRPHPRVGGLTVAEARKEDGLR
jgi:hypothetical protein